MGLHRIALTALIALATLASPPVQAAPAGALPRVDAARTGLRPLTGPQKQAVVLLAGMRVTAGATRLPRATPAQALASAKAVSLQNILMAAVAREAGWRGMERYYLDAADLGTRSVRGELSPTAGAAAARALEARRRALAQQAFDGANAARISPGDARLNALADRIATEVLRRARGLASGPTGARRAPAGR